MCRKGPCVCECEWIYTITVSCTQPLNVSLSTALTDSLGFDTTEKTESLNCLGRRQGRQIVPVTPLTHQLKKTGKGLGLNLEGPHTRRRSLLSSTFITCFLYKHYDRSVTHERPDEMITGSKLQFETIFFTTKHGSNREQQQRFTLETNRSVLQQPEFVFALDI